MKNFTRFKMLFYCGLALPFFISCGNNNAPPTTTAQKDTTSQDNTDLMSNDALIKKGEHIVQSSVCGDCHAPKKMTEKGPEPDPSLGLSGHPANSKLPPPQPAALKAGWILFSPDLTASVGPWGTSFSANLTPDTATGIGLWTEQHFFTAIRKGKFHGLEASRDLLPPMPWQFIRNLTDDELRAVFAYLKSCKPISNAVPAPIPPGK
jgi:hypothetical protein